MGTATVAEGSAKEASRPDRALRTTVRAWLPAAAIGLVAGLLSLPRLGFRSLWLDEAYTVGATNQLFDTWRNTAGTQALYYLLVWPVSRMSVDPVWLRLPSALLGIAAVVVVHRIGRRIGGDREAALAAGGLALSWGLARYSVEARSYTLALLLVSISWLALIAAVQSDSMSASDEQSRRWWRIFSVTTALVPLAHGLATLNYVAQLGALAVAPQDGRRLLRRGLTVAPVLGAELAVLFLLGASDVGDWVPPLSVDQLSEFRHLLLGFGVVALVLGALIAWAAVLAVRAFLRDRSPDTWLRVLPVLWALGPPLMVVVLSVFRPYAAARYVFPSLPGFFLLLAALVMRLRVTRHVVAAALAIAALLVVDQRHVTTHGLEGWTELTACMAGNSQTGDRLVTAMAHRPALDYYWPDHPELAAIEPLAPPEPLGEVRRLYESRIEEHDDLHALLLQDTTASVWYVERTYAGRVSVAGLAFDPEITTHYRLTDAWFFRGNLTLVRLDPIAADRPPDATPCDTVPPPADARPATTD